VLSSSSSSSLQFQDSVRSQRRSAVGVFTLGLAAAGAASVLLGALPEQKLRGWGQPSGHNLKILA
jgi:hypothetical protein